MGETLRKIALVAAALLYVAAGVMHFVQPSPYVKIVPPILPQPLLLVYLSGVAELLGGIGLLVPRLRRVAAWGLVALLLAVLPANIYMAAYRIQVTAAPIPIWLLWLRVPVQFVLMAWVLWCTAGRGIPASSGARLKSHTPAASADRS